MTATSSIHGNTQNHHKVNDTQVDTHRLYALIVSLDALSSLSTLSTLAIQLWCKCPKTHFPHIFTTHKQPTDRPLCLIIRGWIHHLANREILNNQRLSCICSLLPGLMNCVVCIQVQCVLVNLPTQHLSFACALCNQLEVQLYRQTKAGKLNQEHYNNERKNYKRSG